LDILAGDVDGVIDSDQATTPLTSRVPSDLLSLKVVELRRAARRVKGFPLRGRSLARASRDEILAGFSSLGLL
jgi:hypothetical protein